MFCNVSVRGLPQSNLSEDDDKEKKGWRIERMVRKRDFGADDLSCRPSQEDSCAGSFQRKRGPVVDRAECQDRKNENARECENDEFLKNDWFASPPRSCFQGKRVGGDTGDLQTWSTHGCLSTNLRSSIQSWPRMSRFGG